jgi:succinate dehydrogenase / fumarate reductase cytochrome b subunit
VKFLASFYGSSIGKKWVVALTGLMLVGYVVGHLVGNLQIFAGPEQINQYAAMLHSMPKALWVIRAVLIAGLFLHVFTTLKLAAENKAAKARQNERRASTAPKPAKKTMVLSGLVLLSFIVYHLLHFTVRSTDPRFHSLPRGEHDVHTMVILGFQNPLVSGFYLLSVFLLCMHLSHGLQSVLQTLGINSKSLRDTLNKGGQTVSWILFAGYASIPVAVLLNKLTVVAP